MKRLTLLFIFFAVCQLLSFGKVNAQDLKTDIAKIQKAYSEATRLSFDMDASLYTSHSTKTIGQTQTGSLRMDKNLYFYQMAGIEIIKTDKLTLIADHNNKSLMLGKAEKNKSKQALGYDLDSMLKLYSSVTYEKLPGNRAAYSIKLKKGGLSSFRIEFNTKTWMVEKLVMYYKEALDDKGFDKAPPRLELTYRNITTSPSFNREDYSEKKYLTLNKGKYTPKASYSHYAFINTLK